MHIVNPSLCPLAPTAQYHPPPAHTLSSALKFYSRFGIKNLVLVQPSIYADDNSCLLDALRHLTPRHGQGVVGFDPRNIEKARLEEWHDLGVWGVRVNYVSVGREVGQEELRAELMRYADVLRPLGWVLQLYILMKRVEDLVEIVPSWVSKCVLIVLARLLAFHGREILQARRSHGLIPTTSRDLARWSHCLRRGIRGLSCRLRIAYPRIQRCAISIRWGRGLIHRGGKRVVYATGWPHTRFENIDPVPFIERCFRWCRRDEGMIERLFRRNAEEF